MNKISLQMSKSFTLSLAYLHVQEIWKTLAQLPELTPLRLEHSSLKKKETLEQLAKRLRK